MRQLDSPKCPDTVAIMTGREEEAPLIERPSSPHIYFPAWTNTNYQGIAGIHANPFAFVRL